MNEPKFYFVSNKSGPHLDLRSTLVPTMPSKCSKFVFITLSPQVYDQVDEKKVLLLATKNSDNHYIVVEMGSNGTHEHIHALVEYKEERRLDVIKKIILSCIKDGGLATCVVKEAKNIPYLVGVYLQKDDQVRVLSNTYSETQLSSWRTTKIGPNAVQRRVLNVGNATRWIIDHANANGLKLDDRRDFYNCLCDMRQKGYVTIHILSKLYIIWTDLQMSKSFDQPCSRVFSFYD